MSSGPSTPPAPQVPGTPGNGYVQPGNPASNGAAFPQYQAGYAPIGRAPIGSAQQTPYQQGLTPQQIQQGMQSLQGGMGMAKQNFNSLGQNAQQINSTMGRMGQMYANDAQNAGNAAYNPAIGAYQNALNQNSMNIGAQLASQRGSSVNPGLAARNIGQAGATAAQNAAGQMSSQVAQFKQNAQQGENQAYQAQGQLTNQAYGLQGQAASTYGNIANAYAQAGLANQGQILNAIAAQNAAAVAMQSNVNSSQVAMQSNINNANVGMQSNVNDVMANQMMNNNRLGLQQYGMGLDYNAAIYGDQTQASSAQNQNYQNNGLLGLPIPILSDERAKKNIKPAGNKIDKFLRALSAKEYNYKNPKEPGAAKGRHVSPMAQELEKTELGKNMVVNNGGRKMVDYQRGLGTILAAQARLNQRLDSVEKVQKFAKGGMVRKYADGGPVLDPDLDMKLSEMGGSTGPSQGLQSGGNSPFNLGVNTQLMPGESGGIPQQSQGDNGPKSMLGQIMGSGLMQRGGGGGGGGSGGNSTFGSLAKTGLMALLAANKGGMVPRMAQGGPVAPDTSNPNYQPPLSGVPPQGGPQIMSPNQMQPQQQPQMGPMGPMGAQGPGRPGMGMNVQGQGPSMQNFALAGSPNPQVAMPSTGLPMGNSQTRGGAPMPGMGQSGGMQQRPQQPGMGMYRGGRVPNGRR